MVHLPVCNRKHKDYNEILMKLTVNNSTVFEFQKKGKLIICLIEFRPLKEIEHVMAAVLKSYKPSEIGVATCRRRRDHRRHCLQYRAGSA